MSLLRSFNPFDATLVGTVETTDPGELGPRMESARRAFRAWRGRAPEERMRVLRDYAERLTEATEELALLITRESGKPLWESRTEVRAMAAKVEISIEAQAQRCADFEKGGARTRFHPLGVVAVLGPFNFPGHLPNGHIVPALLAGNAVIFKPSEQTPLTGAFLAELLRSAGLPEGVLQVVHGGGELGRALAGQTALDGLFFTGSSKVGLELHRSLAGRPQTLLALEMGGNNPLVVDAEALSDIEAGVRLVCQSAFVTAGQRCTCARRLLLPRGEAGGRFLDALAAAIPGIRTGDPEAEPQPFVGTLISAAAAERVRAFADRLTQAGGRALVPMEASEASAAQLSPGLIDVDGLVGQETEECFGPLLQVLRFDHWEEAVERCNATAYGLAAGLLSEDEERYRWFRNEAYAGIVNWNCPLTGASSSAPFGGFGLSGNHRPGAYLAADYCAHPVASLERKALAAPEEMPGFPLSGKEGGG